MATPLTMYRTASKTVLSMIRRQHLPTAKRFLLSPAYSCIEAWNKSVDSPSYGNILLSEFAVQIHEQLEKFGSVSSVDINIFTHQFGQLEGDEEEAEFVEDILKRYNQCQESFPPCPATSHALIRGYMAAGLAHRLPPLLSDRLSYGLFPEYYSLNLLLDHFILKEDYASATQVGYCSTMQEDFTNPVNVLLCLYTCMQFLSTTGVDDLAPPQKEESDGEEEWIKVKYIRCPYYDDHFDIKDQRFLLGKTLTQLSETGCVDIPKEIRTNLSIIGAGLHHKFGHGLFLLEKITHSPELNVSSKTLDYFSESLHKVESRDAGEPEVEIGLRTVDDEIRKMLPTHEEKEQFISNFTMLKEQLLSNGQVVDNVPISETISQYVKSTMAEHEQCDIDKQSDLFIKWRENQESELEKQLFELRKSERVQEMKQQIKELQEQEELLEYFEKEEQIRLTFIGEDAKEADPNLSITKI